jgi:hypothetical protein
MPAIDRENTPNGPYLAARLRERARPLGLDLRVDVQTYLVRSSHGVRAAWGPEGDGTVVECEVSDRFDAVVLPEAGAELTVEQAVTYLLARAGGGSPEEALAQARQPRLHWWSRRR